MAEDPVGWVLFAICIVLLLLPARLDPAIRWKEAQIKAAKRREEG